MDWSNDLSELGLMGQPWVSQMAWSKDIMSMI